VILALVLLNVSHTQPKGTQYYDEAYYSAGNIARLNIDAAKGDQYDPRWVVDSPPYSDVALKGLDGTPAVRQISAAPAVDVFIVDAAKPVRMVACQFYFPGWTVLVDDVPVTVSPTPITGQITFDLPAGSHEVRIELLPTSVRRWSFLLSLITALLILIYLSARLRLRAAGRPADRLMKSRAA